MRLFPGGTVDDPAALKPCGLFFFLIRGGILCLQDDLLVPHPYFILMTVVITGKEYYDALTYFISFFFRASSHPKYQSIPHFPQFSPVQILLSPATTLRSATIRHRHRHTLPRCTSTNPSPYHNTAATITISRFSPLTLSYLFQFSTYIHT